MPQASIKSFFTANKPAKDGPKPKIRKVDENKSTPKKLLDFSRGAASVGPSDPERHRAFYNYFSGPRRRKNGEELADGRRKMKPYDLQFIELKKKHMEAVLIIQNGYKYQILGEDAYRVSKPLGRAPISGWRTLEDEGDATDGLYDRFASLTFPLERLPFYVEKLVMAGLKVAVAKQLETSALKAQGDNKRGPFRREVTDTYTKGTMVEELTSSSIVTGHLLAITQKDTKFAFVAVQPATGDTVYDVFEDSSVAMELETRLLHIQPSEVLVVDGPLNGIASKLIASLGVRVAHLDSHTVAADNSENNLPRDPELQKVFAVLSSFLMEFSLGHALELDPHPFTLNSFMYLNGDTLRSLEIFENSTNNETHGSLMWVLDLTKTAFGRRMLRGWIGKPLMDRTLLSERVEAMEEILNADGPALQVFNSIKNTFPRLPDLERYTLQVFHGRIAPKQLYWYLYFFNLVLNSVTEPQLKAAKLKSPLLDSLFASLSPVQSIIAPLLESVNANYVRNSRDSTSGTIKLANYFKLGTSNDDAMSQNPHFTDLESLELQISSVRSAFTQFLRTESETLGIPLREVNAFGEEDTFVIGVAKKDASKVPPTWRRQGAITSEVRFWAPFSLEQTKKLKPLLEQQAVVAKEAYDSFVANISKDHFENLHKCVKSLATIDCLFCLAAVSSRPNYTKPDIVDEPCLEIKDGRHPMLEQLMLETVTPNSVSMYQTLNRVMIITGANMGGKSSFVRQCALLVIMAQIGCYIPASKARISIMDGIYTRMGAFDNLMRGESTFMVELKECSAIMSKATSKSLIIMDEIGRGTSTVDGVAIADAVLQYLIHDIKAFTLFITHYPLLCEQAQENEGLVQNWSMDCAEEDNEVTFLYTLVPRKASKSYGINVARLAGLPAPILEAAQKKSAEFGAIIENRRARSKLIKEIKSALEGSSPEYLLTHYAQPHEEVAETQLS